MVEFETEVIDIIKRTSNVKSFRFKIKDKVDTSMASSPATSGQGLKVPLSINLSESRRVDFKAGQYFFVTIKIDGAEGTKHFSFSNSPTEEGYVEFTKRITESQFSKALDKLKLGDWARLRMPYGSFIFESKYKKIAFLSGGIGITPIRSICKFVMDKKLTADIVLLYSNNREEDIIFRHDLDNMQSVNKNIRIVYTLTSFDIDKKIWQGRTGYIDDKMIKEEIQDYNARTFYICGPPGMVESLTNVLRNKLNIHKNQIKTENFAGY